MKTEPMVGQWRVHTPALLKEVMKNTGLGVLGVPMHIFGELLYKVGERASELNDPKLNALMARLTIYEVADPYSPHYDAKVVNDLLAKGEE